MKNFLSVLFIIGGIVLLGGAILYATPLRSYAPYIYTVGAGCVALAQVNTPVNGTGFVLKRLRRQQIFGAILLVLTGFFMMFTHGNEWMVCLSIAAVLELYTAFRIPYEEEKENKNK